ncbi:TonB-dependent receptor plug domain-containing protein [Pseudooceanicola nanhaiensis]|uniref:TonB-dependent receptor plug domain-containing protein n=1 Tax=Pseudooceanicola nanhaiensis TaxID=375761 RepID=UPI001CD73F27|nr:TonB-dependent receptor [Pseudooceanicola nanhaiensis]MCA0921880.1 TonB-dependent receptor [Pseudooceanicola nanhaiensis]
MTFKMTTAVLAITAATAPLALRAQDMIELDDIIVSGGLTPIDAARYGRSATVLTGEELDQQGVASVQDALRRVPGLTVSSTGSSYTQVRIRGGESSHTLILIDGVEAAGGDGEYILTGLETANIERIEVLRGPQSAFYGSNASAGVINIITKKGTESGLHYGGTVEAGSGWAVSGFVSQRGEKGGISLNYAKRDDEGYDYSGSGGEKDGITRETWQIAADYELIPGLTLGASYRHSEETYDYDNTSWTATTADEYVVDDPTQWSDREEQTAQVWLEYESLGGRMVNRLSYERTDFDQGYNGFAPTETETEVLKYRLSYGIDGTVASANHLVTLMLENEQDSSTTNSLYNRETNSIAAEYRGSFAPGLDLQVGVRHDDNDQFGNVTTWNAGVSYTLANGIRLHASAGKGSVNPSYYELFADDVYSGIAYKGNTDLKPEENKSFDIGVEVPFASGRGTIDVTYFNETLTDEITAVMTDATTYTYINQTGDSDRQGVELAARFEATDQLSLRAAYTYLDATNPDGSVEQRRPEHTLTLGATWTSLDGRLLLNGDIRHVAGNYDSQYFGSYGVEKLPDYTVVDVSAQYAVTDTVKVTGRVLNLFDEDYSDTWGYASRGRTAYIGLSSSW